MVAITRRRRDVRTLSQIHSHRLHHYEDSGALLTRPVPAQARFINADGLPDPERILHGRIVSQDQDSFYFSCLDTPCPIESTDSLLISIRCPDEVHRHVGCVPVGRTADDSAATAIDGTAAGQILATQSPMFTLRRGGIAEDMLTPHNRTPKLDVNSYQYRLAWPQTVYDSWCDAGILTAEVMDRILLCPQCEAVATFRFACRACGHARIEQERLIHHYSCAWVAPESDYHDDHGRFACPKCQVTQLTAGIDFEYAPGDYHCLSCGVADRTLEQTGHCLNCAFRFPAHQAIEQELVGYHVHRLDPLAVDTHVG